jgi:hypothetical protein
MKLRPLPQTPSRAAKVNCTAPSGAAPTREASDCAQAALDDQAVSAATIAARVMRLLEMGVIR